MTTRTILTWVFICSIGAFCLNGCLKEKTTSLNDYRDTTVRVYGPYVAVKLPVTKGIKMGNPIQLSLGPGEMLYAANQTGEIYTLHDSDSDGWEDSTALYCHVGDFGLRSPVGFAYKGDTIYIGSAQQIRAFVDTNNDGKADSSWTFFDQIPQSEHPYEWTSGLSFGPDGWLYCAVTTDSWNASPASDPNGLRGAIIRISPDGKKSERIATGIRSVPGMTFNEHGDLFFIDNEGGGNPTEELNRLVSNSFYGHNKKKYPSDSAKVIGPEFDLQSEVAPSSIEFNKDQNDFGNTGGDLFVSYYGPGERWTRGAIGRVVIKKNSDGAFTYKEYTIADIPKLSDLAFGNDGNLYVAHHGQADYWYNAVYKEQGGFYKLIYDSTVNIAGNYIRPKEAKTFSKDAVLMGKQLFAETGCLGCHQVDGTTELLGPNLRDVAKNFSREEILQEILKPSERIKPSMGGVKITRKDGRVLLGRVVNSDEKNLSFMLVGNQVLTLLRNDIVKMENEKKSLMYDGLINQMPNDKRDALLDYLVSLNQ
ncbi:MAG: heme-binding domain protein [Marivirga sp.]|nr:heme-binding domain protein [Marivirga sp.]